MYELWQLDSVWAVAHRFGTRICARAPLWIDKTWRIGTGMQPGPCDVMDIIGLTTIYAVNAAKP